MQLPFTALLNKLFAGPVVAFLHALGISVKNEAAPISNVFAMEILTFLLLVVFFAVVRARLSVDKPGTLQHVMEGFNSFISTQSHDFIGHGSERFTSFLVPLCMFILVANLLGVIPGFESPTGSPVVPLGCALVAFFYYHYHGIRQLGWGYPKHFFGPIPWLAPLMFVIEIFSHLARIMSLTIRLFANMFAGDMVTLAFFSLIPIGLPIAFLGLHIFVSLIQTYVFVLLTTVYLAGAVAEEH
jgi:F-type H+-transporting ATPase subunit a